MLRAFLADAHVDARVFELRPDYRAVLLVGHLTRLGQDVRVERRVLATDSRPDEGA